MSSVPPIDLSTVVIPEAAISALPEELARRHKCVPIHHVGTTLVVAMADPSNIFAIDDMMFVTGYDIEVVVAPPSSIDAAIALHYGPWR